MLLCLTSCIFLLLINILIRRTKNINPVSYPQAILTLGSWIDREEFTAQFGQIYPSLDIWVSTGSPPQRAKAIFQAAGIPTNRLHLDYRAVDTVTNFTTLVKDFQQRQIRHLYLITSDYHMRRAKWIATIVFGSRGITFTPIAIPSDKPQESIFRILRDAIRCIFWLTTGYTGASLSRRHSYFSSYPYRSKP